MTPEQIEQCRERFEAACGIHALVRWDSRLGQYEPVEDRRDAEGAADIQQAKWQGWQAAESESSREPCQLPEGAILERAYLHRDAGDSWHLEPERDPHCDRCTEVAIVRAGAIDGGAQ